jgi:hypothetical protein
VRTREASPTAAHGGYVIRSTRANATPGNCFVRFFATGVPAGSYRLSVQVRIAVGTPHYVCLLWVGDGAVLGPEGDNDDVMTVVFDGPEWATLTRTFTLTAGGTVMVLLDEATADTGNAIELDAAILEAATTAGGPFFTGDTPDEDRTRYSWTGTPSASASIAEAWVNDPITPPTSPAPIFVRPSVTAEVVGQATGLAVAGGTATLDALNVPYATADVEVPFVGLDLDDLDPRSNIRVKVTAADEHAGTTRTFDLGLRERTIDHEARRVHLVLGSDEELMRDYSSLVVDATPRAHEGSLRGLVNYVLGKVIPGAALAAGGPDVAVPARWAITNLITNPSLAVDLTGWAAVQCVTIARYTSAGIPGVADTASVIATVTSAGDAVIRMNATGVGPAVSAGVTYTARVFSPMNPVVASKFRVRLHWLNRAGAIVGYVDGPEATAVNGVWTPATVVAEAPAGAVSADFFFIARVSTAGHTFLLDGAMVHEGSEGVPFFDGSTPDTPTYTYDWTNPDLPNASQSRRVPAVPRPPELFVWNPGTTAWDFLEPFTSSAGLRLYSDEARVWRLIDPASYSVPGVVTLSGFNLERGADTISRDDEEIFATGIVVRYTWPDVNDVVRIAYDVAGTPSKVVLIEYDTAYPGPGAAAAILARRNGTGRTQDVTAIVDWRVTPGMQATTSLPAAPQQRGKVQAVTFPLDDSPLMDVATRGLVDVVVGTIDALPGTIDALPGTIDSL